MADGVFNIAKGRLAHYASLPGTNDALVAVVLQSSGLVADATMKDYETLDDVLAGASNEHTELDRATLTGVAVSVNNTDDRVEIDSDDITWVTPAASEETGKLLMCYDPDTTGGDDTDIIPLTYHDWVGTPSGTDVTATVPTGGWAWAQ